MMSENGSALFFLLGVIVHLVLVYSIFDVYYDSPIVSGAKSQEFLQTDNTAKRLVLFSADGLRSRTFYDYPQKSPYLHSLIRNNQCVFGVSVSHVPTESRPGHVAMLAGIYEDVSAVTRGWSQNPVAFDSIFNQSRKSFLYGSPDIVPMFGDKVDQAETFYYSSDEEDFSRNDAAYLDRWVFQKVEDLLNGSNADLYNDKTVFFLHLLGLDTNGHGKKPASDEYISNIHVVDQGIHRIVELFGTVFPDRRTAFVFTADHGMTDWGSHGSGTDDEVLTPFVIWGHGVSPLPLKEEINQVDLTPLMSALLGIPIPVNSLGIIPLHFLDFPAKLKCNIACANLKQMVEQFGIKRAEKERNSFKFLFKEYPEFKASVLNKVHETISSLIRNRRYESASQICLEWIPRVRDGLYYFHRYNRTTLGMAIAFLFFSWVFLLYTFMRWGAFRDVKTFVSNKWFVGIFVIEISVSLMHKWPLSHTCFYLLPTYISSLIWNSNGITLKQALVLFQDIRQWYLHFFIGIFVLAMHILITVSAFFERAVVSLLLLFIAPLPYYTSSLPKIWSNIWAISSFCLALFPLLPPVGNIPMKGLVVMSPLVCSYGLHYYKTTYGQKDSKGVFTAISAMLVVTSVVNCLGPYLTSFCRVTSWALLFFGFIVPFMVKRSLTDRYISWLSSTFMVYSLLSMAYESVFLLLFMTFLICYVRLEYNSHNDIQFLNLQIEDKSVGKKKGMFDVDVRTLGPFDRQEWQRAMLLIVLIEVAFFGTGNLASLNGFNPSATSNFVTTFSPFLMAFLLILKVAIPLLQLAFSLAVILQRQENKLPRLGVLLMILSDLMAMIFFFNLKDDGSWLEIGMSISHYLICLGMSSVVFLLLHIAKMIIECRSK
ncbi:unnamed protein product [Bursaphelenchus xylophilus]|uniref:GPI ethanolamine phosphate transferase 1 n=1 Tax=Bursaphelenchus xylophilus TaxID=6326 RepID=A0A1I7SAH1_BURXY|nr:unnamed protein product [Bursaphelenchus xylophilus]CAG9083895.1 unnamed protein product [Bursaphelenchus xylophilus]